MRPTEIPEDVLDRVSDGFFAVDTDWRFTYINRAGEELLGVGADELVGEVLWDSFPGAVGTGEPETFESYYEPLERWFEVRAFPSGSGLSVYFRDVTDRRDREAELEPADRQFEVLNRILRHDVRNDVGVVLGWAELLEERLEDGESLELLSRIRRAARDALRLTETAKDVIEVLSTDGAVPLEPVSVRNVLTNAVQHNDTDDPTVEIGVETTAGMLTVRVADDGPGLAPRQEAVFDRGEKGLDSDGTGLGLYLVDELVSRYGGDVRVAENDPRGTVFSIEPNRT